MKNLLLFFLLVPFCVSGQGNLKTIRRAGYQVFAFKINSADAGRYILEDSIQIDKFLNEQPASVFAYGHVDETLLPKGHYVLLSVTENSIDANLVNVTDLLVYPVNNQYNFQLEVRTTAGVFINNATVSIGKKQLPYNERSSTYQLKQKRLTQGIIKVCTESDTAFISIGEEDDYVKPVLTQRWYIFKSSKASQIITWIPRKINHLFSHKYHYKPIKKGSGYVLFNQPKYKPADTVKFKAFIVTNKWKVFKETAKVYLNYYVYGKYNEKLLVNLDAISAGSYAYSFVLTDSLPSDIKYNIVFKDKENNVLLTSAFEIEDYLLDDIATYKLRTEKEEYYPGDTLRFYAEAKDANNLPLLDASARLILTTSKIDQFYKDSLYVHDTIYQQEKALNTEGETVFTFPSDKLPAAQLQINATVTFKNSNNETQEEEAKIIFKPKARQLIVKVQSDSVFANYLVNGKSVNATGEVEVSGDQIDETKTIAFPAKIRIDPLADEYNFTVYADKDTLSQIVEISSNYNPSFVRISKGDTVGFSLLNPYKIPINFIVLNGDKLIASGKSDEQTITWKKIAGSKRKMFAVKWQYTWAGKQQQRSENIALLYKLLDIKIDHATNVYPGQRDSISITVSDYKKRPAQGVNLSAVAYNSQFRKEINVHEPPYLVKYKPQHNLTRSKHETDDPYPFLKYKLGEHKQWIKKFGLDTMLFYQMLFPTQHPLDVATHISEFIPQLSVQVVKKGQPQEITLLYINRQLVYYNGTTEKMKYAFETMQGYAQVGIRLRDKYIEIDSLYMQPFYKHDLFIDLDSLPKHTTVNERPGYFTYSEINAIEKSIWQLDNNAYTNTGFVWQYNHLAPITENNVHLLGPFMPNDNLHYFAPGKFDIHFKFEPGYKYNLSKNTLRLEKSNVFQNDTAWITNASITTKDMVLGDTIIAPPVINYFLNQVNEPFIAEQKPNQNAYNDQAIDKGRLQFSLRGDSVLKYVILYPNDSSNKHIVIRENLRQINNIPQGLYTLLLVNRRYHVMQIDSIMIQKNQTFCVNTSAFSYKEKNNILDALVEASRPRPFKAPVPEEINKPVEPVLNLPPYAKGYRTISGKIIDAVGKQPIPGVTITIKGTNTATASDLNGNFLIKNIKEGSYTLFAGSVGYMPKEVKVTVDYTDTTHVVFTLKMNSYNLEEVVVIGYGRTVKRSVTGSVTIIRGEELSSTLNGRVAGVMVTGAPVSNNRIMIRGVGSINGNNKPIYVVDGILYDELPASIKPEMINSTEVLTDAAATALYGSRAANGVIVITTGTKSLRNTFRDYAFWQPELITDANGKVSFEVVYPDNITGWQLYALAMDKRLRMGKGTSFTNAYKPLSAGLSTPQFLIENDTAQVTGKALNYSADEYNYAANFSINNKPAFTTNGVILPKASAISSCNVIASSPDTITTNFSLRTTTGFKDDEERKIPVFKQGTEEATGSFMMLNGDTSLLYTPNNSTTPIEVYAQNNTLDILLNELDRMKKYPYFCMEQTASKLKGLQMEQQIRQQLKQPFTGEKEMNMLLKKLQENQLFDGGWSWWEKGKPNLEITCYIVETLLRFRNKNAIVESNIRNGLLYLQNQLYTTDKDRLLLILSTLSSAAHVIDYKPYIAKIQFDSLTQHQQWQWIKVCQSQKLDYNIQLKKLIEKRNNGMLGSINWGTENYQWKSNAIATTVLAYTVLENEPQYQYLLPAITQYLLNQKHKGYWRNTVETASIISAILPRLLQSNKQFNSETSIVIEGANPVLIDKFPWSGSIVADAAKPVTITKSGGGLTYLTLYQKWWNNQPESVNNNFEIATYFERNGSKTSALSAGEKVNLNATIHVKKEAGYVMIEIPIPAGCTYASTKQVDGMHREYYKNKMLAFAENLPVGIYNFTIELETRYKGTYTLNPAKAMLMYFPTFYGRNEIRKIQVQ